MPGPQYADLVLSDRKLRIYWTEKYKSIFNCQFNPDDDLLRIWLIDVWDTTVEKYSNYL